MRRNLVLAQTHTHATNHNGVYSAVGSHRRMREILAAMAVLFAAGAQAATTGNTGQCSVAALQPFAPANATLLRAQVVPAGTTAVTTNFVIIDFPPPSSVPEYCLVEGNIGTPHNDEGIGFQVLMPTAWNDKFVFANQGGFAGSFNPNDTGVVAKGYATATTDTGHKGSIVDQTFALGQPGKLIDYSYRGPYLSALAAKALITGYYQKAPTRAIAEGCSGGGRTTLMFAQRFPKLFDGYIVAAPAMDWSDLFLSHWVVSKAMFKTPSSWIPPSKFAALGKAVLAACDTIDGVKDGVVMDPRACHFDPNVLRCISGDGPDCFTAEQIPVLNAIAKRQRNAFGDVIARGWPYSGEEAAWGGWSGAAPAPVDANGNPNPIFPQVRFAHLSKNFIFTEYPDGSYDWRTFNPDFDLGRLAEDEGLLSTLDTNLAPMASRGAKMLFYNGWADSALPPQNSVDYVEAVQKRYGQNTADQFLRLFMVPGMLHCGGGSVATDRFDALGTVEKWLDTGVAPDQMLGKHVDNNVVTRTRPLCAHPKQAIPIGGLGKKSVDDGKFWHCLKPAKKRGHGDDDDDGGRRRHRDDDDD